MLCVGDKVTIIEKDELKRNEDKYPYVVIPMHGYAGRQATVTDVFHHEGEQDSVHLDIDGGSFVWGESWLIADTSDAADVNEEDFDAMLEWEVSQ